MCSVWEGGLEGVEEGRPASLRLPTSLAAVQALPSGLLVLLDQVRPYSCRAYVLYFEAVFRIRIQHFRLNTDPDPGF
jgi:hypothetical protein